MAPPLIRPATPNDVPAITQIYRPAVLAGTATFEIEPPSEGDMLTRWSDITSAGFPYLVAELDGAVRAYAYANHYRTRPAYRFTVEDSVYVAPSHHGLGLGRALLTALIGECTGRGYRQLIAVIGDSAQFASIGLHRSLGFHPVGTLAAVGWKHGRWLDGVLMQLALGEGQATPPAELGSGAQRTG